MAITVSGACTLSSYSGVSTSGPLTHAVGGTNQTNALLVAAIAVTATSTTPNPITSITDSQGNTWQKYTSLQANSGWKLSDTNSGTQRSFAVEIWYTKAAIVNASINITINHAVNVDAAVASFSSKYLGYDATNPFDLNASLPKTLTVNAAAAAQTLTGISTTTTNIYPCWALGCFSGSIGTSNVSFNGVLRNDQVTGQKNNVEFVKGQFATGPAAVGPYSGVTFSAPASADNMFVIGFAITADASPPPLPTTARATIIG